MKSISDSKRRDDSVRKYARPSIACATATSSTPNFSTKNKIKTKKEIERKKGGKLEKISFGEGEREGGQLTSSRSKQARVGPFSDEVQSNLAKLRDHFKR